jgi:hypothetical protein
MLDMNPLLQLPGNRSLTDKRSNDVTSGSESSLTPSQIPATTSGLTNVLATLVAESPLSTTNDSPSSSSTSGQLIAQHSTLVESLSTNSTSSSEDSSGSADEEDSQSDDDERQQDTLFQITHHPHLLHHHRGGSISRKFPNNDKDLFLKSLEVDPFATTKFFGNYEIRIMTDKNAN